MPTLEQATQPIDRGSLTPVAPTVSPVALYSGQQFPPNPNPFLRCPIPPIAATPDSLRQYYHGGLIPQNRIMTPTTIGEAGNSSGSTTNNTTQITSSTTITTKIGTVQSASVTTPVLNPGQQYLTTILTPSAFIPLVVSVTAAARVEFYATQTAQTTDMVRPNTTSPGPATQQGILLDVTIDSPPMKWIVTQSLPAANADSPQKALSYITVTNVGVASLPITASLQYLILEL